MLTINWQHIGEEGKLNSETIYEVSTLRVTDYDKAGCPSRIEIITIGWGSLLATPHLSDHQRIFVMNDAGKTAATYDVPSKSAANEG